jgi:hypothetical protein
MVDLDAIPRFMAAHARLLDRRRLDVVLHDAPPDGVLAALSGYRNPDGGYGWGLEPDLRTPESQPGTALHAFEVLAEIAEAVERSPADVPSGVMAAVTERAVRLCDWLGSASLPDGGLPMAITPLRMPAGTAPWWAGEDAGASSSLQITAVSAATALRVARYVPRIADHPWLAQATRYCFEAIEALRERPHAYVLSFALRFLDAAHDTHPQAAGLLSRLGGFVPASGSLPVEGGTENERLRPLDLAPLPGRPVRGLLEEKVIEEDLDRLAGEQREDGGWTVEYAQISPAGSQAWRGYVTVHALTLLRANGRA